MDQSPPVGRLLLTRQLPFTVNDASVTTLMPRPSPNSRSRRPPTLKHSSVYLNVAKGLMLNFEVK